ncbi:MAG: hypothetical protein OXE76_15895 [Alphaproteobacteria bacterium]|nr:hypothetical protein [Alphaproteobacteria bacterium]
MRKWLISAACAAMLSASAQGETLEYSTAGNWRIAVDPSLGNGCFVIGDFTQGTSIRLGFNFHDDNAEFYILFGNAKWRSIEYGKNYSVQLQFGEKPKWEGNAQGFSFDPPESQSFLELTIVKNQVGELIKEFMQEKNLTLDYNKKEILRLSLKNSFNAGLKLFECQQSMINENQDPFRDTAPKTGDPFR